MKFLDTKMNTKLVLFCSILGSFWIGIQTLQAQDSTTVYTPCLGAEYSIGCAPFTIKMQDCSGADASLILYDYGDNTGVSPEHEHTYQSPGSYYVTQYINDGAIGAKSDGDFLVQVFEPSSPQVNIDLCANNKIILTVTEGDYTNYLIDYGDQNKDTVQAGNPISHTYSDNAPKQLNVSGFVVGMPTGCGISPQTVIPVDSLEAPELNQLEVLDNGTIQIKLKTSEVGLNRLQERISSGKKRFVELDNQANSFSVTGAKITEETYNYTLEVLDLCTSEAISAGVALATYELNLSTELGKNTLQWQNSTVASADCVMVFRDGEQLAVVGNPLERTFYEDTDVKCGQTYCYQLKVSLSSGKATSTSRQKCIRTSSDSNPAPVYYAFASTKGDKTIEVEWAIPPSIPEVTTIYVRKVINGRHTRQDVLPYAQFPTGYQDTTVNADNLSYCYYVSYADECGNYAPESSASCPTYLTLEETPDDIILNWTLDAGGTELIYFLEKLNENDSLYYTSEDGYPDGTLSLSRLALDAQLTKYRIKGVVKGNPSLVTYSNVIEYEQEARLIYPNAFSPNRDGLNDEFRVYGFYVQSGAIKIFNRWGNPVFVGETLEAVWDGKSNGKHVPPGVYILQIEAIDMLGNPLVERKALTVIR